MSDQQPPLGEIIREAIEIHKQHGLTIPDLPEHVEIEYVDGEKVQMPYREMAQQQYDDGLQVLEQMLAMLPQEEQDGLVEPDG